MSADEPEIDKIPNSRKQVLEAKHNICVMILGLANKSRGKSDKM